MTPILKTRNRFLNSSAGAIAVFGVLAAAFGVLAPLHPAAAAVCSADELEVVYDSGNRRIEVRGCNDVVDLTTIKQVGNLSDARLQQESPGIWFLRAHLYIYEGVTLELHGTTIGGDVNWLKIESTTDRFFTLRTYNGVLDMDTTKVTSWDKSAGGVDVAYADGSGRAFVLARNDRDDVDITRMDVTNSDLSYLGYPAGEAYGVAWRISEGAYPEETITGEVHGSAFHHNYYGVYTFGAQDMIWQDNEFHSNIQYGFDPHDDSNGFLVERNVAHDNGNHGFIVSKRCKNNIFRNNVAYRNLHGFMFDRDSNDNLLEGNEAYENTDGLAIYESSNNTIRGNRFHHNQKGIRINGRIAAEVSTGNLVEGNTIDANATYGIYLYDQTNGNTFLRNAIHHNGSRGMYIKTDGHVVGSPGNGNDIYANVVGIYLYEAGAKGVILEGNTVHDNTAEGILVLKGGNNTLRGNTVQENGNYGVKLSRVPSGTVEANRVEDNTNYGIYVDGGTNLHFLGNTLLGNGSREFYAKNAPGLELRNNVVTTDNTYGLYLYHDDNALLEGNSVTGTTPGALYVTSSSTGLTIRDTDVTDLRFGDTASAGQLLDTRNYVWENSRNLAATVDPTDARIAISKANAATLHAERRDLAVDPSSSSLTVRILAWDGKPSGAKSWMETSAVSPLPTGHLLENLSPLTLYAVTVDGQTWGTFVTTAKGDLSFTYDGPYQPAGTTFALSPAI